MQHMQIQIPIAGLPVNLVLITDSSLAFVRAAEFKAIIENEPSRVPATFDNEGFTIDGEGYQYNTKVFYKEIPSVLKWLQQNKLELPSNLF